MVPADAVIITTGTFLRGEIHIGLNCFPAGRYGEGASFALSDSLTTAGFSLKRLKTGTPPRLLGSSIDWSCLEPQPGEVPAVPFSFMHERVPLEDRQIKCYQTRTNQSTHKIILENLDKSIHIRETVKGPRFSLSSFSPPPKQ